MTQPYSSDLRERVVRAHLAGEPIRRVAARFGVSVSSVPKWVARYRATGSVAPARSAGATWWGTISQSSPAGTTTTKATP